MKCIQVVTILSAVIGISLIEQGQCQFNANYEDKIHECTTPGLLCRNCTQLVFCTPGSDSWIAVQTCNASMKETCLIDKCTTEPNPECYTNDPYIFECTAEGIFPDPFDCKKYYFCLKNNQTKVSSRAIEENLFDGQDIAGGPAFNAYAEYCDTGYGYDAVSTYCKVKLDKNTCPSTPPVPMCRIMGQNGALSNKSIYYICVMDSKSNLIPKLLLCPHGQVYLSNMCRDS